MKIDTNEIVSTGDYEEPKYEWQQAPTAVVYFYQPPLYKRIFCQIAKLITKVASFFVRK